MIRIRDSYRAPGKVHVTYALIAINILSFIASINGESLQRYALSAESPEQQQRIVDSSYSLQDLSDVLGVIPAEYVNPAQVEDYLGPRLEGQRVHALVSVIAYMFLHGGWFHLLTNMLILFIFGPNVEVFLGRARFLLFYLSCGAAGALCHVLPNLGEVQPMIGASAAISGLFGAYFAVFPGNYIRITLGSFQTANYRDIMVPVRVLLICWLVIQLLELFIPAPADAPQKIAYLAHIGGFICGYFLAGGKGVLRSGRRNFKVFMGGKARRSG